MIYAIDAYPMYQQAVYQAAPAVLEHPANGSAGFDSDAGTQAAGRIADARIHCVVSGVQQKVAVCDNGTLISMKRGAHGRPAHLVRTAYTPPSSAALPVSAAESFGDPSPPPVEASSITRRWFADLLMTFGIGFLLVSAFLFVTSRASIPDRRYHHQH